MVRQMTNRLEARKKTVAPMLQELRPLREQYQVHEKLVGKVRMTNQNFLGNVRDPFSEEATV